MGLENIGQQNIYCEINDAFFVELSKQISCYLNAITGLSELLIDEQLEDESKQYACEINEASRNAVSMLNDAVELWGIEKGDFAITSKKLALDELLSEICAIAQPEAAKKGLEFAIIYCSPIPSRIHCNLAILRKCLTNLAINAIESTDSGYVHIKIKTDNNDDGSSIRFDFVDCSNNTVTNKPCDDTNKTIWGMRDLNLIITGHLAKVIGGEVLVAGDAEQDSAYSLVVPTGLDITNEQLLNIDTTVEVVQSRS